VSETVREKHLIAGFPPSRMQVKPNFVAGVEERSGAGEYFLYLGRLSSEKGPSTLVAAHDPRMGRMLLVGDGPEREHLIAVAGRDVTLPGAVASQDVPALIAGARALLVPTRCYEGAPVTVLEAYAAGVPVIASHIGAVGEMVEHDVSGLLVPPDDPQAWAEALCRLLDDAESLRLGAGARRLWEGRYTPAHGLRNLEAAYSTVLADHGVRTRLSVPQPEYEKQVT